MSGIPLPADIDHLRRNWGWLVALGILLIVLGTVALSYSFLVSVAEMLLFACLLLGSGAIELVNVFRVRQWGGALLHLLAGMIDLVLGVLFLLHPVDAALTVTLFLAAVFMVGGLFRVGAALVIQQAQWGWTLLSGIITFALGVLLWTKWPVSGLWFIGLCVAIDLIFRGWTLLLLGLAVRSAPAGTSTFAPSA